MLSQPTYFVSTGNNSCASPVISPTISHALLPMMSKADKLPSWCQVTKFFLGNFYSMGYNLNVRNGKSTSKIAKWPSLRPLKFKSKFIRQFEFSENVEDLYGKCCWRARSCSPTTFSIQILFFSKFRLS